MRGLAEEIGATAAVDHGDKFIERITVESILDVQNITPERLHHLAAPAQTP
jgi:hypothetical protein